MPDVTDESETVQAEAIRDAVAQDAVDGIASTTVDGMTVNTIHPMTRLDVADRLKRNTTNVFQRMRTGKLRSPAGGFR